MKVLITAFLAISVITVYGQSEMTHKIDQELQSCLDASENYTTMGMAECLLDAYEKWDVELNENYKKLLAQLSPKQREKLKVSQRKWLEFRDMETSFSNQLYTDLEGTMWILSATMVNLELTKKRALELEVYLKNLNLGK